MLAVIAFIEIVAVGLALALRAKSQDPPVVVERVVTEYLPYQQPAGKLLDAIPQSTADPAAEPSPLPAALTTAEEMVSSEAGPLNASPTLKAPFIANPEVERLVVEAREARVRDNIGAAVLKLESAEVIAPAEPNVLYQFAEVFSAVGHYDKAADYYQKVFNLGPVRAGALYELASRKLSLGFEQAMGMEGKMRLGRIRHYSDRGENGSKRVVLTIPILAAPGQGVDKNKLSIQVTFYDKRNGKVYQATSDSNLSHKWTTPPLDWGDTGEELLQYTYIIPPGDERDLHLLGERAHFGQVVEMRYGGELIDHQAWPRTLAEQRNVQEASPLFIPSEFLPRQINEANPLLPPLPR
ncbi:MAG: hypothetical protein P8M65_13515 [Roseibacillus sp.]|nr:hypothetical protein [Roseibacillus sp.]